MGYESIMVNCNPETVSTDFDTADRLYFEPLTAEDVLNIIDREQPSGVLVQFGGQTPLNIAHALHTANVPIWGTSVDRIDLAEDRERFHALMQELNIEQPRGKTATTFEGVLEIAQTIWLSGFGASQLCVGGVGWRLCLIPRNCKSGYATMLNLAGKRSSLTAS
jgi:carbamoyl-phosphate synthase large subunit